MTNLNPKLLHVPKHIRDKMASAALDDTLKKQYGRKSMRVIKGDSIKVLRGEYAGIEGKVSKVNIEMGTLEIEGIQREKVRGGNVKVPIHSSNVKIVGLELSDKLRLKRLQPLKAAESEPTQEQAESKEEKERAMDKKVKSKPKTERQEMHKAKEKETQKQRDKVANEKREQMESDNK
jgi:large subunit ribosomal protein L24